MIAYCVYSLGNGQLAVVVAGRDYREFDTPAEARAYILELIAEESRFSECQLSTQS